MEARQLLAGNVTLTLENGVLTLIGDDAANEIFLGDRGDGNFSIYGLAGTTINNTSTGITTVAADIRDVVVQLGRGNDRFLFSAESDYNNGQPYEAALGYQGFGPLYGEHGYARLAGALTVELGAGFDTTVITAAVEEGIDITGGAGDDGIFLRTPFATAVGITGPISIDTAEGDDYLALSLQNVGGPVTIATAGGNDQLLMAYRTAAELLVTTGAGHDRITIEGGYTSPGFGGHRPAPVNGTENTITVHAGSGTDTIRLTQLFANNLNVNAGLDGAFVVVQGVNIRNHVSIRGGGALGSRTVFTDLHKPTLGSIDSAFHLQAETYIDTQIGGNVTIQFNVQPLGPLPPDPANRVNRVNVGQQSVNGEVQGFQVGGEIRFFGTVFEDDLTLQPLRARAVTIDMGYGNDGVTISGVQIPGSVRINLNEGNDRRLIVEDAVHDYASSPGIDPAVLYTPTYIGGDLAIDYGAGNEQTVIPIEGGPITDTFFLGARRSGIADNFYVAGNLALSGGRGINDLTISGAHLGTANLHLGQDNPTQLTMRVLLVDQSLTAYGSIFTDTWLVDMFGVGGDLELHTGDGNDHIRVNTLSPLSSRVGRQLLIDSGRGNDMVDLGPNHDGRGTPRLNAQSTTIRTVGGNDVVNVRELVTDTLLALLGDGDDSLLLRATGLSAELDGGAGDDSLGGEYVHGEGQRPVVRRGFETDSLLEIYLAPDDDYRLVLLRSA